MNQKSERGQALILIVFAIIGLIGMTALTVDGGISFANRRSAQNAADSAAWAAALAYGRGQDVNSTAYSVATQNNFDNNGTTNTVTVTQVTLPSGTCPRDVEGVEITVEITSLVDTYFGPVLGIQQVTNRVLATTRTCNTRIAPLFDGNAIVGLNPGPDCAFDSDTGNATWELEGGGIFSNGCAVARNNVTLLTEDTCVTTVGSASGFSCEQENQTAQRYDYPDEIAEMMPENPCDGTAGDVGIVPPAPPNHGSVTLTDGVYCISDFDAYDQLDIILSNATLYVTDTDFDLRFAGGGGFSGTPSFTDEFSSYYLIIALSDPPCPRFTSQTSQVIVYRGNGLGSLYGTVLAPSACIDFRGNSTGSAIHSQIIGYNVSANGTADNYIQYVEEENRRDPLPMTIELIR